MEGSSPGFLQKVLSTVGLGKRCQHLEMIDEQVVPKGQSCQDCLKSGDVWVQLRLCLTCGYVGCSDTSKNQHARRHYHETGHPVIQSFQAGEDWRWCYADEIRLS